MAQTTGGMSLKSLTIEGCDDGSSWDLDLSGFAAAVVPSGGDRQTGEEFTFDGDTAIITRGKRNPILLMVRTAYTEGASDPFETVRAIYEAGTAYYLRWSPKGGASGDFMFTTGEGTIESFNYPGGEAAGGTPTMCEFVLKVARVTKSAVA